MSDITRSRGAEHSGHRNRMRQKFVSSGMSFEAFPPHEALEMMLFFCCKRQNTNPLAHRLLERFGSLDAVLRADTVQLSSVEGVGTDTAVRLAFWRELMERCEKER
ncbi:MAG: hypothetical protein IJ723_02965 [Ruminococcus sp.]|nr:hypothetical protein [Ruminococcus sp.]